MEVFYDFLMSTSKRHCGKVILFLILLVILFKGLYWLVLLILLLHGTYRLGLFLIESIKISMIQTVLKSIFLLLYIFVISLSSKILVFDIYRIPSSSMENTLLPEDIIVVDKLFYGPKLPRSPFEVSWIDRLFYLNENARKALHQKWWGHRRLNGVGAIRQGDILVFENLQRSVIVKRCVAIAGDTLAISAGHIYTNGKKYKSPATVLNRYRIKVKNKKNFYRRIDSLGLNGRMYLDRTVFGSLEATLTYSEYEFLETLPEVETLEVVLDIFDIHKGLFAMPKNTKWTLDYMGPIIVPKQGCLVSLNPFTFSIYAELLRTYEGIVLTENEGSYYDSEGKKITEYRFKQDYFFVMGDDRKNSKDSRYVGFVPKENIVGKAKYVLLSNNKGKFRWNRVFKEVNEFKR